GRRPEREGESAGGGGGGGSAASAERMGMIEPTEPVVCLVCRGRAFACAGFGPVAGGVELCGTVGDPLGAVGVAGGSGGVCTRKICRQVGLGQRICLPRIVGSS